MTDDELIAFFKDRELPTEPVKINGYISVTDSALFIDSCKRQHERGEATGFLYLAQYKTAIEQLEQQASQQSE